MGCRSQKKKAFISFLKMAFLRVLALICVFALIMQSMEARSTAKKRKPSAKYKKTIVNTVKNGYDERWARAITHFKAEKKELKEDGKIDVSRQFQTGISCGCSCRVAPTSEIKEAVAAAAAAAVFKEGDDSWKPRRTKRSLSPSMKEAAREKERIKLRKEAKKNYLAKKWKEEKKIEAEKEKEKEMRK